jgi:hypothetical protein
LIKFKLTKMRKYGHVNIAHSKMPKIKKSVKFADKYRNLRINFFNQMECQRINKSFMIKYQEKIKKIKLLIKSKIILKKTMKWK